MLTLISKKTLLIGLAAIDYLPCVFSKPIPSSVAGSHLFVDDIKDCPVLSRKEIPGNIYDVRPDHFTVVMALGDSITAGLFAQPSKLEEESQILVNERNQKPFQPRSSKHPNFKDGEHSSPFLGGFEEYRGRSYAMGGDKDAITIPQLMQHYRTDPIKGTSHNHHPPPILPAPPRTPIGDHVARNDGLNAAVSGAKAVDIPNQVKNYLLPSLKEFDVDDSEWKFLTLSIGANDVCDYCLVGNASRLGPGSPEAFVSSIETSIELVRQNIPRTIVNVVGLFTVSEIYNLTMKAPACSPLSLPPIFPRLPLECSCAWAPGPLGDATRRKMDALGEQYAHGLQQMVKRIRENVEREAIGGAVDFGIIWQPGSFLPLGTFPTTTLSPIDCFHPSAQAHERIATGLWNRLVLNETKKRVPMTWRNEVLLDRAGGEGRIRCLAAEDRISFD